MRQDVLCISCYTGSPHICLEYRACFCVLWRPFWIFNTRSASAKSGTEITEIWDRRENSQILGGSRSLTEDNKVTRDETPDWLSSHVSASWGNENKMWKRDRKSIVRVSWAATCRTNGVLLKRRLLQVFWKMIQLSSLQRKWNVKESTLRRQKFKITEWWVQKLK